MTSSYCDGCMASSMPAATVALAPGNGPAPQIGAMVKRAAHREALRIPDLPRRTLGMMCSCSPGLQLIPQRRGRGRLPPASSSSDGSVGPRRLRSDVPRELAAISCSASPPMPVVIVRGHRGPFSGFLMGGARAWGRVLLCGRRQRNRRLFWPARPVQGPTGFRLYVISPASWRALGGVFRSAARVGRGDVFAGSCSSLLARIAVAGVADSGSLCLTSAAPM